MVYENDSVSWAHRSSYYILDKHAGVCAGVQHHDNCSSDRNRQIFGLAVLVAFTFITTCKHETHKPYAMRYPIGQQQPLANNNAVVVAIVPVV